MFFNVVVFCLENIENLDGKAQKIQKKNYYNSHIISQFLVVFKSSISHKQKLRKKKQKMFKLLLFHFHALINCLLVVIIRS